MDWKLYPNPVSAELQVTFKQLPKHVTNATFSIFTMDGKRLHQSNTAITSNQTILLDCIKDFEAGTYMLSIEIDEDEIISQKFIKK